MDNKNEKDSTHLKAIEIKINSFPELSDLVLDYLLIVKKVKTTTTNNITSHLLQIILLFLGSRARQELGNNISTY